MKLLVTLLAIAVSFVIVIGAQQPSLIYSIEAEANKQYKTVTACARLLNSSTTIGCQTWPTNGILYLAESLADINRLQSRSEFANKRFALVLPPQLLNSSLIDRLESMGNVAALIVVYLQENTTTLLFNSSVFSRTTSQSDDGQCPECDSPLSRSSNADWIASGQWNPLGRGLVERNYRLPLFAVLPTDKPTIKALEERLQANINSQYNRYPLHSARLTGLMYAAVDTETCLERSMTQPQYFCLPIGGMSVYSTPSAALSRERPLIWLSSRLDSRSLFLDMAYGGSAYTSGLIVAMSVADAISKVYKPGQLKADLFFTMFNTEGWSHSGSKRFARDINEPFECREPCTGPLNCCQQPPRVSRDFEDIKLRNIAAYIELGQLLNLGPGPNQTYSLHSAMQAPSAPFVNSLITMLQQYLPGSSPIKFAQSSLVDSTPLPPSSIQSFLAYNRSIPHILLQDHDRQYRNPVFNSPLDDSSRLTASLASRLCELSTALARSAYGLAMTGSSSAPGTAPLTIQANCTLITELWDCLMKNFSCPLVNQTLGQFFEQEGPTSKYSGFIFSNPLKYSPPDYIRFLHKWMANTLKQPNTTAPISCRTNSDCLNAGNATICSNSQCIESTTRFHESFGTGLEFDTASGYFRLTNRSLPNWVQSNFDPASLELFEVDSPESQIVELSVSVIFAVASILAVSWAQKWLEIKF